jgi:PASTA domain
VFAILAAIAVPALVAGVVLLGSRGGDARATPDPPGGDTPRETPTLAAGSVRVPNTIGMSEAEAQAAAEDAGLAWRIEWRVVPGQRPGIYEQDPAPGEVVERGSPFVMFAYRSE